MKILVVDGDPIVVQVLKNLLSRVASTVDVTTQAEVGLQRVSGGGYDLIVLDRQLSGLDDLSLGQPLPPILWLVAGEDPPHQTTLPDRDGANYIVKPFEDEDLIARVQALLHHKNSSDQQAAALRPQEALLHSIYDGAAQSIFLVDVTETNDFRYVSFNRSALQATGFSLQFIQGKTPEEVFGADLGAVFRQHYEHCLQANSSITYEDSFIFKDRRIWTITTLSPLFDETGRLFRIVGTVLDISDRKWLEMERWQANAALQQSEEQRRLALDLTNTGSWDLDLTTQTVIWSEHTYRLLGLEPGSVEPGYAVWRQRVHPEDIERLETAMVHHLEQRTVYEAEYRVIYPDGSLHWVLSRGHGIYDEAGQATHMVGITIDISDRKQLELSLQASEAKLSQILDSAIAAIISFRAFRDGRWEYDYFSAGCETLLGYPPAAFMEDKTLWRSRMHPEDRRALLSHLFDDFFAEHNIVCEYRFYHRNGSLRWISSAYTSRQISEDCWQVTTVSHDITDRKQAEEQLQFRQAQFEALVTNMPGMVYRYFPKTDHQPHRFTFVSHHAQALLELAPETILQDADALVRLIHPEDLPSFLASIDHAVELFVSWHWEGRVTTPSGKVKWIQGSAQAQLTPEGAVWDGLFVDVTAAKLAKQKIQEQAALLDIASDGIFVRDLDHRILYWNKGAERLYGWTAAEAIGQRADTLLQCSPAHFSAITQTLLAQGEWRGEFQDQTKTNQPVTVAACWTLVRDETGQPKSILSVVTDITEKKRLEGQFYQAQRLESLGRLASGIAHDLNNVFTPIVAMAQLLRLSQAGLNAQGYEQLKLLEDSAKRGTSMVQQILSITRGSSGERTPIHLGPLLQDMVIILQKTFPKDIGIESDIPDATEASQSLGAVLADPTHLHQIFMNLCVNARDAMPTGGRLTVSAANAVVDAAAAQRTLDAQVGNYVVVTIADTGTGIPPEVRDRIFDPFFTTKSLGKGTGLGLATVLGIVKNYGGFVQVFSEVGQGTQVQVYLPALDTPSTVEGTMAHPAEESTLHGQGELILVVDDDAFVQRTTQSLLEIHDYTTLIANNGHDALQLYHQHPAEIRLVILDVMMPNMDGIDLVHRLRALNPALKMIAISGLPKNRKLVLEAGANTFLVKPYALETLLKQVQDLLTSA